MELGPCEITKRAFTCMHRRRLSSFVIRYIYSWFSWDHGLWKRTAVTWNNLFHNLTLLASAGQRGSRSPLGEICLCTRPLEWAAAKTSAWLEKQSINYLLLKGKKKIKKQSINYRVKSSCWFKTWKAFNTCLFFLRHTCLWKWRREGQLKTFVM